MPIVHALQPTFGAGEIAPALHARTDFAKYQAGLKRARNVIIHPAGGAYNRAGFLFVAKAKDSTHPVRTIEFQYSNAQSYILELGHLYARFYFNGGQVQVSGVAGWVTSTAYKVGDLVVNAGTNYYCQVAHTSGVFATDLAAGKWYALTGTIYEIPTPWAGADLAALKFWQSADTMYLTHPSYPIQQLVRAGATNWQLAAFSFQNGPFMLENVVAANTLQLTAPAWVTATNYVTGQYVTQGGNNYICLANHTSGTFATDLAAGDWRLTSVIGGAGLTMTSTLAQFQAGHVGSLWKLDHAVITQVATDTLSAGGATGTPIRCGSTWSLITNGTWTGTLIVQMSTDNGLTWHALQTFTSQNNANYNTTGQTGQTQCLIRLATVGGGIGVSGLGGTPAWSGSVTASLSSNGFDWIGIVKVTAVTDSTHATVTALTLAGDTVTTSEWSEGAWSTYRGFPSCGAFFQDRLCMAATPSQPQTIWMSKTSSYADFGVSIPLVDSDSINVNLPSQSINAIQSLAVPRDMIAVTAALDWAILSTSGSVTPTSVQIVAQGKRGASAVQPIIAGLRMILVQPMGTVVRDLAFSIYTNSYDGSNLSLVSSHLFTGFTIVDARYQQEPDSLVWMVRSDGVLLSMTYLPEQEVVAWTWHDTQGAFESIASIPAPSGGYNQLWAVANRGGTRFIELMDRRLASSAPEDQFFVDCGLKLNSPIAITGMTNASPVVVTAPGHGFVNGDVVDLDATVVGMESWTDANGNAVPAPQAGEDASLLVHATIAANGYVVAGVAGNTFQLTDTHGNPVDGTKLSAYVSGGNARKQVAAVSGLDHLNGKTVAVLANGFVQTPKVVAGGSITLDQPASRVSAGLSYRAEIETLNLEFQQQDGTLQGRKVKIAELTMRVLNTGGALKAMQGEDPNQLDVVIPPAPPATLGRAPALFTGDVPRFSVRGGYDYGAHVWVRQDDPLPMMVLGLIPRAAVGA